MSDFSLSTSLFKLLVFNVAESIMLFIELLIAYLTLKALLRTRTNNKGN